MKLKTGCCFKRPRFKNEICGHAIKRAINQSAKGFVAFHGTLFPKHEILL